MRDFPPIDHDAEADALQTLFFSDGEFEGRPHRVSRANYLAFLSLRGAEIAVEVEKLRAELSQHSREDMERDISRLLRASNWRFHNIACVALAAVNPTAGAVEALWQRVLLGSWTSPQLVATAAYVDSSFKERAGVAVASRDTYFKSIVPLAAVLQSEFGTVPSEGSPAHALLLEAQGLDRDRSGDIAVSWLANLRAAFDLTGRSTGQPSAAG
jgi:hypothetical protein